MAETDFEHMDNRPPHTPSAADEQEGNERWYYSQGETVNGPFLLSELLQKAEQGVLNAETLVVPEGSEDWRSFSAIAPANQPPLTLTSSQPAASPEPEKKEPTTKETLQGCGCLVLILVVAVFSFKGCLSSSKTASETAPSEQKQEERGTDSLVWDKIDVETRKESAELKLRDAEQLAKELEELLREFNRGNVSVELVGKAKTWRHGVDFILSEVAESGWKVGRDDSATAMGQVYSALQSMAFAWDSFQKFAAATSPVERESRASAHANHLKLMRENLRYAHEWLEKGRY